MESFLTSISSHLKLIPDHRPKNLEAIIHPKCRVLNFPVNIHQVCCDIVDRSIDFTNTSNIQRGHQSNGRNLEENIVSCVDHKNNELFNDEHGDSNVTEHVQECCTSLEKRITICDTNSSVVSCNSTGYAEQEMDRSSFIKKSVTTVQDTSDLHPVSGNEDLQQLLAKKTCLHIVWPHRWEHDKDPDSFFKAILQLQSEGLEFCVSVVGETFTDVPDIFDQVKLQLMDKIVAWGYQTRHDYLRILDSAHVAVSTALHEFFGVSMLEATGHGCYPLCPKRLVYPEIYPEECLYSTQTQLVKRLRRFCQRPDLIKTDQLKMLVEKYSWHNLQEEYRKLLLE